MYSGRIATNATAATTIPLAMSTCAASHAHASRNAAATTPAPYAISWIGYEGTPPVSRTNSPGNGAGAREQDAQLPGRQSARSDGRRRVAHSAAVAL